jgi:hypothetical protein
MHKFTLSILLVTAVAESFPQLCAHGSALNLGSVM